MKYDCLSLDKQLCFPIYAVSHLITKKYKPFLDDIGLTYTQYITMMVLWEKNSVSVKELGHILHLDSGTLTPLLKRLEKKRLLTRHRSEEDERLLIVSLTSEGTLLQERAHTIPSSMGKCIPLNENEAHELYRLLYKILDSMEE
jgi:DNA-binding MarR family transcriptional regulator